MKNQNEMIEKLKTTWTAFGGLSKEEQEFLKEHSESVVVVCAGGALESVGEVLLGWCNSIYRLEPDFELPAEEDSHYFFCLTTGGHMVHKLQHAEHGSEFEKAEYWLEVSDSDLPYLKKPDGDWEFRKAEKGVDTVMAFWGDTREHARPRLSGDTSEFWGDTFLQGYRWCRPRKAEPEGRWLECEIKEVGMKWQVFLGEHPWAKVSIAWLPLSDASDLVGFGGVQFKGQDDEKEWSMHTAGGINSEGVTFDCIDGGDADERVATPVRARFWVEG